MERKPSMLSSLTTPGQPNEPVADSPVSSYMSGFALMGPLHGEADYAALIADLIDEVSATSDATGGGFEDADGEAGRYRGVDGVAALSEHSQACAGCLTVFGGDHCTWGTGFFLDYAGDGGLGGHVWESS